MSSVEKTEYLLLGGGITNLAFAEALGEDGDYQIFEALDDVGGYCRTIHQDGFTWDYSGHFFHFRHPEIEQQLVSRIGKDRVKTVEKRSFIHYADRRIDFPFQKNIHQLSQQEFIECLVDLFESDAQAAFDNFEEMLYRKFGKGIAEKFLIPYNEKLYATSLKRLDPDAMGRFFPYADKEAIVRGFRSSADGGYNATFTYPEGGAIEYVRAFQSYLAPERIHLNERILSIDLDKKIAKSAQREIHFEKLISAAPFPALLKLCGADVDESLYTYNQVLVFNLGFDKKGISDAHWIYFPERSVCFYRIGFYDNIFDTSRMSLYVELGYSQDVKLSEAEIADIREEVLKDLRKVGIITDQALISHHHIMLDPAYVHITSDSNAAVIREKAKLEQQQIYSIGRYGSWTYCSIEDNILEARALAAQLSPKAV